MDWIKLSKIKSGIRYGQKKYLGNGDEGDTKEKFRVIYILRQDYGLHGLTGEAIFIPRSGWCRYPDIFVKATVPQTAILLHGDAPFHTEGSETEMNVKLDYDSAGINLIIIWEVLTQYNSDKIRQVLDANGLKRI